MSGCSDPQECQNCGKHLYEYQHEELQAEDRVRIAQHLNDCDYCRTLLEEEQVIRRRVQQCADETAPETLRVWAVSFVATYRRG